MRHLADGLAVVLAIAAAVVILNLWAGSILPAFEAVRDPLGTVP